jgi:23S rRNA (adenine2030-N6)-methyltransferase
MIRPGNDPEALNGCGLVIVNPPWQVPEQIQGLLAFLTPLLAQQGSGRWRTEWLAGE